MDQIQRFSKLGKFPSLNWNAPKILYKLSCSLYFFFILFSTPAPGCHKYKLTQKVGEKKALRLISSNLCTRNWQRKPVHFLAKGVKQKPTDLHLAIHWFTDNPAFWDRLLQHWCSLEDHQGIVISVLVLLQHRNHVDVSVKPSIAKKTQAKMFAPLPRSSCWNQIY